MAREAEQLRCILQALVVLKEVVSLHFDWVKLISYTMLHQGSCLTYLVTLQFLRAVMPLKLPRHTFKHLCVPEGQGSHFVGDVTM